MKKSKKLVLTGVVIGGLLTAGVTHAASQIKLFINGNEVYSDVPPQVINGTTMVPLRLVAESLNAEVEYDAATNSVYVSDEQSGTPTDLPVKDSDSDSHLVGEWYIDGKDSKIIITSHKGNELKGKLMGANGMEYRMDGLIVDDEVILKKYFDGEFDKYRYAIRDFNLSEDEKDKLAQKLVDRKDYYYTYKFKLNGESTSYDVKRTTIYVRWNSNLNITSIEPFESGSKTYKMTKIQ